MKTTPDKGKAKAGHGAHVACHPAFHPEKGGSLHRNSNRVYFSWQINGENAWTHAVDSSLQWTTWQPIRKKADGCRTSHQLDQRTTDDWLDAYHHQ